MKSILINSLRLAVSLILFGCCTHLNAAVVSGSYTGDGTDGRAISVGFQPDVVFVQRADTGMRMQYRVTGMTEGHDLGVSVGNTGGTVDDGDVTVTTLP